LKFYCSRPVFSPLPSEADSSFSRHESHELIREIFDKVTPKEISADLELSTSCL